MQKVLAVDCLPQAVVVLHEGSDEFMQAGPGYFDVILRRHGPRAWMRCATLPRPLGGHCGFEIFAYPAI